MTLGIEPPHQKKKKKDYKVFILLCEFNVRNQHAFYVGLYVGGAGQEEEDDGKG